MFWNLIAQLEIKLLIIVNVLASVAHFLQYIWRSFCIFFTDLFFRSLYIPRDSFLTSVNSPILPQMSNGALEFDVPLTSTREGGGSGGLVALSSKMGGGERKAVDFQRIIIHVIIIGHSSRRAILVLYLAATLAIYNFALRPRGIGSSVEFRDALCTYKLGTAKNGERDCPSNQLQWTSIFDSLDLRPFRTSKNCCFFYIFINFRGLVSVVWAYKFSSWQFYSWVYKMSCVRRGEGGPSVSK